MSTSAKSWDDMSTEEKQARERELTTLWLEQAREDSPLTVLTSAAAIIMVLLKNAPEDSRLFVSMLLQDLFESGTDVDVDLSNVLLN